MEKKTPYRPELHDGQGGLTLEEWEQFIALLRKDGRRLSTLLTGGASALDQIVGKESTDGESTVISKVGPLSVEQIAILFDVDLEKFEVERLTTNKWEVGAKFKKPDGTTELVTEPLFQTKVIWKQLQSKFDIQVFKEEIIKQFLSIQRPIDPVDHSGGDYAVELVVADHHIGKVAFTGGLWDIEKAVTHYGLAIEYFIQQLRSMRANIGMIIFPVGNDFCHIDNIQGSTTKGTPMQVHGTWLEIFRSAQVCAIDAINKLRTIAPVKVVMVEGNHDAQSTLALGEVLSAYYMNDDQVIIDNSAKTRKYTIWGKNCIGHSHGDNINYKNIATTVLGDLRFLPASGTINNVYFRVGHLHKSSVLTVMTGDNGIEVRSKVNGVAANTAFIQKDEISGVEIEVCPSLCPTDKWHDDNGYGSNQRRSVMFIYNEQGLISQQFYHLNG